MSPAATGLQPVSYDGSQCGPCTWCCRIYRVVVPTLLQIDRPMTKLPGTLCWWQGAARCALHGHSRYPDQCSGFACPHILLDGAAPAQVRLASGAPYPVRVHRPDAFAKLLSEPWVEAPSVMPLVPACLPVDRANALMRSTQIAPAAIAVRFPDSTTGFEAALQRLVRGADVAAGKLAWAAALQEYTGRRLLGASA